MACELPYIDPATARQYSYYVIPHISANMRWWSFA